MDLPGEEPETVLGICYKAACSTRTRVLGWALCRMGSGISQALFTSTADIILWVHRWFTCIIVFVPLLLHAQDTRGFNGMISTETPDSQLPQLRYPRLERVDTPNDEPD